MTRIPLRTYNREIEGMIDRGQASQAISHGRHVLKFFPKHIDTYRLIGKAFLELQRYSEAADMLQRVLACVPDDFISQIGMGIIREDEGNLDAAIWHMERAFEAQPSNVGVQDELRRLYGRRDGVAPAKIRLTRGALVRMYARGELYQQAIAEIRASLAEDPQRIDLEVILARMYFLSGQKVAATEVCTRLLAKLPFCFEGNRILAEILPGTSRAEDARSYLRRVHAMDPYLAHLSPQSVSSADVPDNAVELDHLEWLSEQEPKQPSEWTKALGADWSEQGEPLPEWLSEPQPPATVEPEMPVAATPPVEPAAPTPSIEEHPQEQPQADEEGESQIPYWIQQAGWMPAKTERPEESTGETPLEEGESVEESPIEEAEIPDWLAAIAPQEEEKVEPVEADLEKPGWLEEILPPLETEPKAEEVLMEAPEMVQPSEQLGKPASEFQEEVTAEPTEQLGEVAGAIYEEAAAEPAEQFGETVGEIHEEVTAESEGMPELSADWLNKLTADEIQPEAELAAPSENIPEEATEKAAVENEFIPDWLKDLQAAQPEQVSEATDEEKAWSGDIFAQEPEELAINEGGEMSESEFNLEDTQPTRIKREEEAAPEAEQPQFEKPAEGEIDQAMSWLESLAAKQGAQEETLFTPAEERTETMPDWLHDMLKEGEQQEVVQPEETPEITPPAEEAPAPEVVVSATEGLETPLEETIEEAPAEPAPIELEVSEPFEAEPTGEATIPEDQFAEMMAGQPEEPAPEGEPSPEPTEADVKAFLESLEAAPQAAEEAPQEPAAVVSETETVEMPEESPEVAPETGVTEEPLPDWLQAIVAEEEKTQPEAPAEAPAIEQPASDESLGWLHELTMEEETPTEAVPAEEPAPSEEISGKIPGAFIEGQNILQKEEPEEPGALPEWLRGVDEEKAVEEPLEEFHLEAMPEVPEQPAEWAPEIAAVQPLEEPAVAPDDTAPLRIKPEAEAVVDQRAELLKHAQEALDAHNIERALDHYNQLIESGDYLEEIIHDLRDALYRYPIDPALWQTLGDAYMKSNHLQDALDAYTKAEDLLR